VPAEREKKFVPTDRSEKKGDNYQREDAALKRDAILWGEKEHSASSIRKGEGGGKKKGGLFISFNIPRRGEKNGENLFASSRGKRRRGEERGMPPLSLLGEKKEKKKKEKKRRRKEHR